MNDALMYVLVSGRTNIEQQIVASTAPRMSLRMQQVFTGNPLSDLAQSKAAMSDGYEYLETSSLILVRHHTPRKVAFHRNAMLTQHKGTER